MTVSNSASGFDNWSKMTIFAVIDEQSASTWRWFFSKAQTFNSGSDNAWSFMTRRADISYLCLPALWSGGSDTPEFNDANFHNAGVLALLLDMEKELCTSITMY